MQKKAKASKARPQTTPPTKASHLSDKTTRRAMKVLELRFHRAAIAITPAAATDSTHWPLKNNLLVMADGTLDSARVGRASDETASANSIRLTIHSAHSGRNGVNKIFKLMLESGEFDALVDEYNTCRQSSMQPSASITAQFVSTLEEIKAIYKAFEESRKAAGGQRTNEQLAEDENIGVSNESLTDDEMDLDTFISGAI